MGLSQSRTQRDVYLSGVGVFQVRPPTVEDALLVADALRVEEVDWSVVREGVAEWLPLSLSSILFSASAPDELREQVLQGLLVAGGDTGSKDTDASSKEPRRMHEADWNRIVARYRRAFGLTWQAVMKEPWHAFLLQCQAMPGVFAREQLRLIEAYAATKSKSKKGLDRIQDRAGIRKAPRRHRRPDGAPTAEQMLVEAWQVRRRLS